MHMWSGIRLDCLSRFDVATTDFRMNRDQRRDALQRRKNLLLAAGWNLQTFLTQDLVDVTML